MNHTALLTDRYELTMLSSLLEDGLAGRHAVFETFARRLPEGRRYGVTAGLGRLLPLIQEYRFTDSEIRWLLANKVVTPLTARYLETFTFTGTVKAYMEGELYFPNSPILTVEGTLGECIILETLILSVLNYDSAVAAAASRMVHAANGRNLLEMGSRRVHEEAAVAAARAAYLAGFTATSNLAAGMQYGIPTIGTAAHAFTLAYPTELEAFTAQIAAHGTATTLLVDTYDTEQGIRNAVTVAGTDLRAIRLDSGDPAVESRRARMLLDELGATNTKIVVTGDMDEFIIAALTDAPIDTYGVGTRVSTGSGHPAAGLVYKLVAVSDSDEEDSPMRAVAKTSEGKASMGGKKTAFRMYDRVTHKAAGEELVVGGSRYANSGEHVRILQRTVMEDGLITVDLNLSDARDYHARCLRELSAADASIANGSPSFTATVRESAKQEITV